MNAYRIDDTPRRIRARLGTATVLDSTAAKLVYLEGRHPEYHAPLSDLDPTVFRVDASRSSTDPLGTRRPLVDDDGKEVGHAYVEGPASGLVRVDHDAVDAWLEEDEQMTGRPRDPFRRVDVLESSRHVEIRVDGELVAATHRPRLVTETGLAPRWYIPRADVDWSRMERSETTSRCQYKGEAEWWSIRPAGGESLVDVAWGYERPLPEAPKLAGLVAFYAEHDSVRTTVDGVVQEVPAFRPVMLNPALHSAEQAA